MNAAEKTVLVVASTSDIGRAIARTYADQQWGIQLAARNQGQLDRDADDLRVRYDVAVATHVLDVLTVDDFGPFLDNLDPLPDTVVCVVGFMGSQADNERDSAKADVVLRTNFNAPAQLFGALANRFEQRGSGTLIGISSVAGERGRATNYVYGSAKAGFTAFLSGLRNRLAKKGVHVITVNPGFVRTRMTEGMPLPDLLTAEPEEIGTAVFQADQRRRNVVYARPIWRWVMAMIRAIPESIFKRLRL